MVNYRGCQKEKAYYQTLTPLMSGPGNEALSALPPAKTELKSKINLHKIRVMKTNERAKPSGDITLLTMFKSVVGPTLAAFEVSVNKKSVINGNIMMPEIFGGSDLETGRCVHFRMSRGSYSRCNKLFIIQSAPRRR
jgi:hypothetical protein